MADDRALEERLNRLRQVAHLEGYRIERAPEGADKYDLVDLHSGERPQRWPLTVDELEVFLEID